MKEHIESAPPRPVNGQLEQIKAALKGAESHYAWLMGHCPSNAVAIRAQTGIIKQYERQIAELESLSWLM